MVITSHKYLLYADDDPDDQSLLVEILAEENSTIRVVLCNQGLELVQFLEALPTGSSLPCCIVLDLNMPIWDGVRTLEAIKQMPTFNTIPVVIFTSSKGGRDIQRTKELGADGFITKPDRQEQFSEIARKFLTHCASDPKTKN